MLRPAEYGEKEVVDFYFYSSVRLRDRQERQTGRPPRMS